MGAAVRYGDFTEPDSLATAYAGGVVQDAAAMIAAGSVSVPANADRITYVTREDCAAAAAAVLITPGHENRATRLRSGIFAHMRVVSTLLRLTGAVLAIVVVVLAGFFVTALVVNRDDRPPSDDTREMAAVLEALPDVPDAENGYVYMLGFAAPRDADPWAIGATRAEWIRRLRTDYEQSPESDPYSNGLAEIWDSWQNSFFSRCRGGRNARDCFAALSDAGAEVDVWLEEQRWVLARYEALLEYSSWRDIDTYDHRNPYPTMAGASAAHSVWFLAAWVRAAAGDAAGVREMLSADLNFWRVVLAESGSLLTKAIASSMIERHFELSNVVLNRLPRDSVAARVADLEGIRRAALLTAELRSIALDASEVEAALANAAASDPYTGQPLAWDAEAGETLFDGIASRYGGRHTFWY